MAHEIKSPLPGTFYRKPAPQEPAFKEIGDQVATGETIGLVEVMKTFHEIKSDGEGKVKSFEVEDSGPVKAGQVLVVLS